MIKMMFIKAAPGPGGKPLLVRDPATRQPLDPEGEWKPDNLHWRRVVDREDAVVLRYGTADTAAAEIGERARARAKAGAKARDKAEAAAETAAPVAGQDKPSRKGS